jgi:RHH-type proline utilization regulon transcriptional repressor/proline dehydrogenase/delta 1-pyrroline-5-carboxylate dehydrogenase
VLHVLRFRRDRLEALVEETNATGYGLTFGVHSRIDETIARVTERTSAGNVYVNRNLIGAVVGVQPFGGHGLSGTGPKAGGPLYVRRLLAYCPAEPSLPSPPDGSDPAAAAWLAWLEAQGKVEAAARCAQYIQRSRLGLQTELRGPVGESNVYSLHPRGSVLCVPTTEFGLLVQVGAALATGNAVRVQASAAALASMPAELRTRVVVAESYNAAITANCAAVLFEGDSEALRELAQKVTGLDGPIRPAFGATPDALRAGAEDFPLDLLVAERSVSTNTTAAGGNANLMTIG